MKRITSRINPADAAFRENDRRNRDRTAALHELLADIRQGGSDKARERHTSQGKLMVRDRIEALLDPGSPFLELSPLAGHGLYDGGAKAAGLVTGALFLALMIVIWNALVLHARWGKLVKARGLAMLAVFGNVVTAWSWFGVNQLGVGLHSYGFTSGVRNALFAFAVSQLVIMAAAAWTPRENQPPTSLPA